MVICYVIIDGKLTGHIDAAREFPEDSWESHEALQVGNDIINAFVVGNQDSIIEGRKIAQKYLGKNVDSSKVYDTDMEPIVYAIGHCHIGELPRCLS
jgi:alpha-mannosidase